jgi:hypothetical protein
MTGSKSLWRCRELFGDDLEFLSKIMTNVPSKNMKKGTFGDISGPFACEPPLAIFAEDPAKQMAGETFGQ